MIFLIFVTICTTTLSAPLNKEIKGNITSCGDLGDGDCLSQTQGCKEICGCNRFYYYNATENTCVLDIEYLRHNMKEHFDTQGMIQTNADKVFKGIIISAILFITCASICVITACIYCCKISYTDSILHKDINALAAKLKRDGKLPKVPKNNRSEVAESCNVIVEDAGVFVC